MSSPTRFLSGISTEPKGKPLSDYPYPDPFHTSGSAGLGCVTYYNDFFTIGSTTLDFTLVGAPTFAVVSSVGGVARITPAAAATVSTVVNTAQGFQFISGQKMWYVTRFKPSAIAAPSAIVGLQAGVLATRTHGLHFAMAAGGVISLVSTVNGVATTLVANVATASTTAYTDVAFHFDGTDLLVFANDALVSRIAAPTIGATGTTLTNSVIGPVYQITPTASDTLDIDYVLVAEELSR